MRIIITLSCIFVLLNLLNNEHWSVTVLWSLIYMAHPCDAAHHAFWPWRNTGFIWTPMLCDLTLEGTHAYPDWNFRFPRWVLEIYFIFKTFFGHFILHAVIQNYRFQDKESFIYIFFWQRKLIVCQCSHNYTRVFNRIMHNSATNFL